MPRLGLQLQPAVKRLGLQLHQAVGLPLQQAVGLQLQKAVQQPGLQLQQAIQQLGLQQLGLQSQQALQQLGIQLLASLTPVEWLVPPTSLFALPVVPVLSKNVLSLPIGTVPKRPLHLRLFAVRQAL